MRRRTPARTPTQHRVHAHLGRPVFRLRLSWVGRNVQEADLAEAELPHHTEAAVDLTRLAGRTPAGVICELTNPDGTMARLPEVIRFADTQQMPVVSIEDLVNYIKNTEQLAS